jgi:K(+)-stimulated pyrophosphate-energized sodium pump
LFQSSSIFGEFFAKKWLAAEEGFVSLRPRHLFMKKTKISLWALAVFCLLTLATNAFAGEADIKIPPLDTVKFAGLGGISGIMLMYVGIFLCFVGAFFGLVQYKQTKALPVHSSMGNVSHTIWETCKTYLFQQGKFLAILWVLIAACIFFYFKSTRSPIPVRRSRPSRATHSPR